MNLFYLSVRNLLHRPLNSALTLLLFALGTSIISLMLLLAHQMEEQMERNLAGISLVVGAKGSPLQLILSSIYHVDFPTGNISLAEAEKLAKHPLIAQAIPLALGDSYRSYRIVGTERAYPELYKAELETGNWWAEDLEVTIGAEVARRAGLQVGSHFHSSHGMGGGEDMAHEEHDFIVTGILKPTGTVIDQLILTNVASVWKVHEDHGPPASEQGGRSIYADTTVRQREITSLLIRFKSPMGAIALPRQINQNTNMQAASPAFETARLFSLLGTALEAVRTLAIVIMLISGLSVFISLYHSLQERKYEIAWLRVLGATRPGVFGMVLAEGLLLALFGCLLGLVFSHTGLWLLGRALEASWKYSLNPWAILPEEWLLLPIAAGIGIVAALIPAWQAVRRDVSGVLSGEG